MSTRGEHDPHNANRETGSKLLRLTTKTLAAVCCLSLNALQAQVLEPANASQPILSQQVQQVDMPIRITGEYFSSLFGTALDQISVITNGAQGIKAIPAQWTQLTDEGTVYTAHYKKIPFSGDVLRLDKADRLELLYKDAGVKSCKQTLTNPDMTDAFNLPVYKQVVELQVQPMGFRGQATQRYICLASGSTGRLESKQDYIQYDLAQGEAKSAHYRLLLSKDNPLIWQDFYYRDVNLDVKTGRTYGESILDSLKINIQAGLFTELTRVHLDNTHLRTQVVEVQHGPIYDSLFALTRVKLAGATVLTMQVMMHFYPDHVEMKTRFKVPSIAKTIVKSPQVDISLDANNMWGSQIQTSWGPLKPLFVNGELDAEEQAFTEQEVNSQDTWVWFSTQRGFDVLTFIDFDQDFQVPIALVYEDNKTKEVQPERFPGQGPNVGYSIRGMVMGRYFTFNTNLLFSKTLEANSIASRVVALKAPWSVLSSDQVQNPKIAAGL